MSAAVQSTGLNELSCLPPGWQVVPLGKVARLVNGDAYKDSDWSECGTPIIRIQNLNDPSKPFNYWAGPLDDRVIVESGDVLLAWSGTPGTSFGAHLWRRGKAVLNQHIFRVDLDKERLIPQWAVWAINQQLQVMIGSAHGGVGLRHVKRAQVESLAISLPPLQEQHRIVAMLNGQIALVERAQSAAQAELKAAKALPGAYLRAVFESNDAQNWPRRPLAEIASLLPSKSISLSGDCEVRTITTACLTESGFNPSGVKVGRMWTRDAAESVVAAGEILVARSNTPELVGRAALFRSETNGVVASDLTIRVQMRAGFSPEFMAAYLSFLYLTGYWKERAGGASGTMKKITRSQIQAESVPTPDYDTQLKVADEIAFAVNAAKGIASAAHRELAAINALPKALIDRAFIGKP